MIIIYTDGSSIGNPGPGGWAAIIWYTDGIVKELAGREKHTTNNRMEIQGAIESLEYVLGAGQSVKLFTDSSYLINGITKWIHGWQKNGWITGSKEPVLNKELWEELYALTKKWMLPGIMYQLTRAFREMRELTVLLKDWRAEERRISTKAITKAME